jgi:hypothetical protein
LTVEDRGILGWRDGGAGDTEAMTAVIGARMREREGARMRERESALLLLKVGIF